MNWRGRARVSLFDLFGGRRRAADRLPRVLRTRGVRLSAQRGCRGCSLGADRAHLAHLNARDTTLAYVSRAPQADIARLKARMGWKMPWYSITDSFDADFGVDEWHGHNVFFRDGECSARAINSHGDEATGHEPPSTSLPSAARRSGRIRRRAIPRRRRTSGGTGTTTTTPRPRLTRSGSRCPTLEKPPSESATQRRKYNRGRSRPLDQRREP